MCVCDGDGDGDGGGAKTRSSKFYNGTAVYIFHGNLHDVEKCFLVSNTKMFPLKVAFKLIPLAKLKEKFFHLLFSITAPMLRKLLSMSSNKKLNWIGKFATEWKCYLIFKVNGFPLNYGE